MKTRTSLDKYFDKITWFGYAAIGVILIIAYLVITQGDGI